MELFLNSPDLDNAGVFVATPPVALFLNAPNLTNVAVFTATPPVSITVTNKTALATALQLRGDHQ
jgi:hypothetical protein